MYIGPLLIKTHHIDNLSHSHICLIHFHLGKCTEIQEVLVHSHLLDMGCKNPLQLIKVKQFYEKYFNNSNNNNNNTVKYVILVGLIVG